MSSKKRLLSIQHSAIKKKRARKECPGCRKSYSRSYYIEHTSKNNVQGEWLCKNASKEDEKQQYCRNRESEEPSPQELSKKLKDVVRSEVIKFIDENEIHSGFFETHSSEEEDEIWTDVSQDDIRQDLDEKPEEDEENENDGGTSVALVTWLCLFLCFVQVSYRFPDTFMSEALKFFKVFLETLGEQSAITTAIAGLFPGSVYLLWKFLGKKNDNFIKYVVCKKCFSLYRYDNCIIKVDGKETSKKCSFVAYPNHTQKGRRKPCGESLLKSVTLSNGKQKLYPFKSYCYRSVTQTLKGLIRRPSFEANCEKWRNRKVPKGSYRDVYDGRIWQEFMSAGKKYFLNDPYRYGVMINLDWFQPFEHVSYSVGVIYGVILNLPLSQRFKLENVMLIGIIPDMGKEPPCGTFLRPLVDELQCLWNPGVDVLTYESPRQTMNVRLALMCTGCDVPATRKLCGFLGHTANYACSKCMKLFPGEVGNKNYSGFDRELWPSRNLAIHRDHSKKVLNARTQTERAQMESQFGVRYSPFIELEYFDPIRMSVIDPMHNMFLGTAKQVIKVWIKENVLGDEHLDILQQRVDAIITPTSIGRIPRKIASSFGGFTAEQWKNWVNIFSIYALKGLISSRHLENWRKFVLASRMMCSKCVSEKEVQGLDSQLLKFCKEFEELFSAGRITPNMHLHGHLAECIRDYGPVYNFWLFSFERYNGHLGSLPNNNRSVEIQFMRRFLRDGFVTSLSVPKLFTDSLYPQVRHLMNKQTNELASDRSVFKLLKLSNPKTRISGQNWSDIKCYVCCKKSHGTVTVDELSYLKKMYSVLYPETDQEDLVVPQSVMKCGAVRLGNTAFGSVSSRLRRSSKIMANWNAGNGKIVKDDQKHVRPGVIERIFQQNIQIDNTWHTHLIAQVSWYTPTAHLVNSYGPPIETWARGLYDTCGESSFMPLQRILCQCAEAYTEDEARRVMHVWPLASSLDI